MAKQTSKAFIAALFTLAGGVGIATAQTAATSPEQPAAPAATAPAAAAPAAAAPAIAAVRALLQRRGRLPRSRCRPQMAAGTNVDRLRRRVGADFVITQVSSAR